MCFKSLLILAIQARIDNIILRDFLDKKGLSIVDNDNLEPGFFQLDDTGTAISRLKFRNAENFINLLKRKNKLNSFCLIPPEIFTKIIEHDILYRENYILVRPFNTFSEQTGFPILEFTLQVNAPQRTLHTIADDVNDEINSYKLYPSCFELAIEDEECLEFFIDKPHFLNCCNDSYFIFCSPPSSNSDTIEENSYFSQERRTVRKTFRNLLENNIFVSQSTIFKTCTLVDDPLVIDFLIDGGAIQLVKNDNVTSLELKIFEGCYDRNSQELYAAIRYDLIFGRRHLYTSESSIEIAELMKKYLEARIAGAVSHTEKKNKKDWSVPQKLRDKNFSGEEDGSWEWIRHVFDRDGIEVDIQQIIQRKVLDHTENPDQRHDNDLADKLFILNFFLQPWGNRDDALELGPWRRAFWKCLRCIKMNESPSVLEFLEEEKGKSNSILYSFNEKDDKYIVYHYPVDQSEIMFYMLLLPLGTTFKEVAIVDQSKISNCYVM